MPGDLTTGVGATQPLFLSVDSRNKELAISVLEAVARTIRLTSVDTGGTVLVKTTVQPITGPDRTPMGETLYRRSGIEVLPLSGMGLGWHTLTAELPAGMAWQDTLYVASATRRGVRLTTEELLILTSVRVCAKAQNAHVVVFDFSGRVDMSSASVGVLQGGVNPGCVMQPAGTFSNTATRVSLLCTKYDAGETSTFHLLNVVTKTGLAGKAISGGTGPWVVTPSGWTKVGGGCQFFKP